MIRDNAVVYEMDYPHPPEWVWRALVTPAELARWLMPPAGFAAVAGQRFTMTCEPFGEIQAVVTEVDPPRRLAWEWTAAFGRTLVTFELADEGGSTRLTLVHRGWDQASLDARTQFDSGWNGKLGQGLRELLGTQR